MRWEDVVLATWRKGQEQSSVGPGVVEQHLDHARAIAAMIDSDAARGADLGTGAGIPGLALAGIRADMEWTLLDASRRRIRIVAAAVETLGWGPRVRALHARAETLPDRADWEPVDVVVARLFGRPATTAECAAPLLAPGGQVLVTMPPDGDQPSDRFPDSGIGALGLERGVRSVEPHVQELRRIGPPEPRFPRRDGVARRRPLW